ncbi:uncharacterized protein F5891DRAFT_1016468 [Suillus fuscotomentosus]|uniref:Uncharacterized protein n=1 Tax=Suillus fuscotomentosus TaxID=1912939 RepID=A0AAD4EDC2_9AGAM|nr:uncharacterized protein F5891DRAFT_1016468 [Suillus fuscotomentosus]KAG1904056.1 hypothetical protein F5891DRAFT_1016468 [Suillus fuscotomentosus]
MGRSDDNISFGKPHPTMHVPAAQLGSLTLPAGYPQHQNISPLLSDQLRRDTTSRSRENVPSGFPLHHYAQSQPRDVFMHSGAIGGSSAYRSAEVGSAAHVPYGISNRDSLEVSMHSLQDTSTQSSARVVPSHTINFPAQSYEGNAIHSPRLHHAIPSSDVDANTRSFANNCYISDVGPPAHVPGGIPDRNYLSANPVPWRPATVLGPFSGTASYGSKVIAPRYEGDVRHVSELHTAESYKSTAPHDQVYRRSDHSRYGIAPSHPPPQSSSSIPASRTQTLHPSAHQPTPFVEHTVRVVPFCRHDTQRSASPQVYHIDGCFIDKDDVPDQGTNNDIIIVGECLRNDSPCGLWVKADKGSIKRHAQKWHGVARGGDTNIVLCTWAECNTEMQKGAMPRHTLCKHFRETFQCNGCLKKFTRDHCWRSHVAKCTSSGTGHGYSVSYDPSIRTIDVKGMSQTGR